MILKTVHFNNNLNQVLLLLEKIAYSLWIQKKIGEKYKKGRTGEVVAINNRLYDNVNNSKHPIGLSKGHVLLLAANNQLI